MHILSHRPPNIKRINTNLDKFDLYVVAIVPLINIPQR